MTSTGKRFYWLVLLMLCAVTGFAQKSGMLRGVVSDSETGETLPNVGITIVGTYLSAVTDFDGRYQFPSVPAGDYSIKVQVLGYGTQVINGLRIQGGAVVQRNIKLSSSVDVLQT